MRTKTCPLFESGIILKSLPAFAGLVRKRYDITIANQMFGVVFCRGSADKNLSAFFTGTWLGMIAYHVTRTKGTHSV